MHGVHEVGFACCLLYPEDVGALDWGCFGVSNTRPERSACQDRVMASFGASDAHAACPERTKRRVTLFPEYAWNFSCLLFCVLGLLGCLRFRKTSGTPHFGVPEAIALLARDSAAPAPGLGVRARCRGPPSRGGSRPTRPTRRPGMGRSTPPGATRP